jgi:hypothetical protein
MAGIRITPKAATVAGPEPDIAAKKQEVITATMARPAVRCPTALLAKLINLSDIPDFSIIIPANMKKGMASNVNLPVAAAIIIGNISSGVPVINSAAMLESPRATAIGTFRNNNTVKTKNNTAETDI